jgi:hypothetical protein
MSARHVWWVFASAFFALGIVAGCSAILGIEDYNSEPDGPMPHGRPSGDVDSGDSGLGETETPDLNSHDTSSGDTDHGDTVSDDVVPDTGSRDTSFTRAWCGRRYRATVEAHHKSEEQGFGDPSRRWPSASHIGQPLSRGLCVDVYSMHSGLEQ